MILILIFKDINKNKLNNGAFKIEKIYNFFESIKSDIITEHFDSALLRIKKVIDIKELMDNDAFRSLIYYYSALINMYINKQSIAEKFVKKGIQIASKSSNSFFKKIFKELNEKIIEIQADPRDLIKKLVELGKIEHKMAFNETNKEFNESELPEKIYSAEDIHEFYLPVAMSKFGDPFEVIKTLEKALEMTKGSNDPKIIQEKANILFFLGSAQITIEELKGAQERLKKGLEISKQIGNNDLAQRIQRILDSISDY